MDEQALIELHHVDKYYQGNAGTVQIFSNLDFKVSSSDFVSIMGPSGSGKSTMLNLLGGLDRIVKGEIISNGQRIDQLDANGLSNWRSRNIGFVFQSYNLIPFLSAAQNIELPLLLTDLNSKERERQVATVLEIVGLEDRKKHKPSELSGGQQQRVAIGRAIVADPKLILADEPTGDLDRNSANEVMEIFKILNRDIGKAIVMVTHDPTVAAYGSRQLRLDKGIFFDDRVALK